MPKIYDNIHKKFVERIKCKDDLAGYIKHERRLVYPAFFKCSRGLKIELRS